MPKNSEIVAGSYVTIKESAGPFVPGKAYKVSHIYRDGRDSYLNIDLDVDNSSGWYAWRFELTDNCVCCQSPITDPDDYLCEDCALSYAI